MRIRFENIRYMLHGARSEEFGWWGILRNWFISQKLLHCEGGVTRCIAMVQNPLLSPFFQPSVISWFFSVICFHPQGS
jgi:hypothetical protein